jgi:hypothetical protein
MLLFGYGRRASRTLGSNGLAQESLIVSKYNEALKLLKWVDAPRANLKEKIRGDYDGVSENHFGLRRAEFSCRFNRHTWDSRLFSPTFAGYSSMLTVACSESRA